MRFDSPADEDSLFELSKKPPVSSLLQHDESHPDHVDVAPIFDDLSQSSLVTKHPRLPDFMQPDVPEEHRKVYLSPRDKYESNLKPISITVPLKIPDDDETGVPAPRHLFKYKKYTTYETKPEIQMVPVTKTILKPVGVSADQIVDDEGLLGAPTSIANLPTIQKAAKPTRLVV